MMEQIQKDSVVANETKAVVQTEEEEATVKAEKTQAIADDAQKDLDEALPMLDAALASLKSLNKNDVVEVCFLTTTFDDLYQSLLICHYSIKMLLGASSAEAPYGCQAGHRCCVHHEGDQTQKGAWRKARSQDRRLLGSRKSRTARTSKVFGQSLQIWSW